MKSLQLRGIDADGKVVDVPFVQLENFPSREQVLSSALELMGERLTPALEREISSDDVLPGIDTVETWGAQAAELVSAHMVGSRYLSFGPIGETADGVHLRGLGWWGLEQISLAFHRPEALIADIAGLREIVISGEDETIFGRSEYWPGPWQGKVLEWRAYFGEGTLTLEEESNFFKVEPDGNKLSLTIELLNKPSALVGRFLHWMGTPDEPSQDRFRYGRLKHFEERHPDAAKHPDLGLCSDYPGPFKHRYGDPPHGPVMVFIHGTFSCTLPNLAQLSHLKIPVYRFEHDTFQSIESNVESLVKAIRGYLSANAIHFVAHSRGGLVARLAARELVALGQHVTVRTYGTPHLGTPLANAGARGFNALLSMGRTALRGVFPWDPASLAAKIALKPWWPKMPEGIDEMRTDSRTINILKFGREPFPLVSYGGEYDLRELTNGACAYALGEILHGAFGQNSNDTVVPTASALGAGTAQPQISSCNHFEYFSNAALQDELMDLG